ncbi:MAG: hypothetical protein DDT31_00979 [Syntrophomonadaceae bacterium]|nr:hypothetical protein [Bacillota bacterium]
MGEDTKMKIEIPIYHDVWRLCEWVNTFTVHGVCLNMWAEFI